MNGIKIVIDADGCPVVDITITLACKYGIRCILVCDTAHIFERENAETVTVDKGADSADYKTVSLLCEDDIAVTQDYGLAAMCLAKKARAVNQNGLVYSDKNIESLLYSRFVNKKLRMSGAHIKGPSKRTREQNDAYAATLKKLIEDGIGKKCE